MSEIILGSEAIEILADALGIKQDRINKLEVFAERGGLCQIKIECFTTKQEAKLREGEVDD